MKIEVLYPEICNLFGELANVRYLKKSCPELEIVETDLKSRPCFLDEPVGLVYMGSTTERGLKLVVEALRPYREELIARIDAGQLMLVTGNALDVFGRSAKSDWGLELECLGLFQTDASYQMLKRHNSMFLGKVEDMTIVGFKSLFGLTSGAPDEDALFQTQRGVGRNAETKAEGFRRNNLLATYLIGPLLPMNPPFAKYLLRKMGLPDALAFEETAQAAYALRVKEFEDPGMDMIYH